MLKPPEPVLTDEDLERMYGNIEPYDEYPMSMDFPELNIVSYGGWVEEPTNYCRPMFQLISDGDLLYNPEYATEDDDGYVDDARGAFSHMDSFSYTGPATEEEMAVYMETGRQPRYQDLRVRR